MMAGRIEGATRFLGAPKGWDEARDGLCGTLPILDLPDPVTGHRMASAWLPTPEELEALNAGAAVVLFIVGTVHPPVAVAVGQPPEAGA